MGDSGSTEDFIQNNDNIYDDYDIRDSSLDSIIEDDEGIKISDKNNNEDIIRHRLKTKLEECRKVLAIVKKEKVRYESDLRELKQKLSYLRNIDTLENNMILNHATKSQFWENSNVLEPYDFWCAARRQLYERNGTYYTERGFYFKCKLKTWDINKLVENIYGFSTPESMIATLTKMQYGLIEQWKSNTATIKKDLDYLKSLVLMDVLGDGISMNNISRSLALSIPLPDGFEINELYKPYIQNLISECKIKLPRETLTPFERNNYVRRDISPISNKWLQKIVKLLRTENIHFPNIRAGLPDGYLSYIIPKQLSCLDEKQMSSFLRFCNLLDPVIWNQDGLNTEFIDLLRILKPRKKDMLISKDELAPNVVFNYIIKILGEWIKMFKSRNPDVMRNNIYPDIISRALGIRGLNFDFAIRAKRSYKFLTVGRYGDPIRVPIADDGRGRWPRKPQNKQGD